MIAGQKALLTRTMHSIAYDAVHDEIIVPQFYAQAILTFRGGANGNEAPIRILMGPDTGMINPDRLYVDPINNEIYVPEADVGHHILVFPREAKGNVKPIRVLEGPDTQLSGDSIAVDPVHDLLIVAGGSKLLLFDRTASGNTKPKAIIGGPNSRLRSPNLIEVYPPKEAIFVTVRGGGSVYSTEHFVGVWSIHDNGDVPPRWMIGGPNGMLRQIRGVALDPKNKSVIITDKYVNAILTYYFPEAF